MYFNRIEAKMMAKASMRQARPNPMLVTLVYMLLSSVITVLIPRLMGDPFNEMTGYLMMGYEPAEVFEYVVMGNVTAIALFCAVSLLLEVYSTIMAFGYTSYGLRMARREACGYSNLFDGFQKPLRVLWADILVTFFSTLWGLLGMIPGLVLMTVSIMLDGGVGMILQGYFFMLVGFVMVSVLIGLRYGLTNYFILDDPNCTARQAIRRSKEAMKGWKMELFTLKLSFFGWVLFGVITAGIAMIWVGPYMEATMANFYDAVVGNGYDRPQPPSVRYVYDPNADGDGPPL